MGTQFSLIDEVPPVEPRAKRWGKPTLPADMQKVLAQLAPILPSNFLPRIHPTHVEIPCLHKHAIEKELRKVGFKAFKEPLYESGKLKAEPGAGMTWRYWRRAYVANLEET